MMVRSTVPAGCQISLESCWERFAERQGDLSVATATKELQGRQGPHSSVQPHFQMLDLRNLTTLYDTGIVFSRRAKV